MNCSFKQYSSVRYIFAAFGVHIWLYMSAQPATYTYDTAGNPTEAKVGSTAVPVIAVPPRDALLQPGARTDFSMISSGAGLSYQWLSNGVPILGATGDSLILSGLSLVGTNLGNFYVIVSNTSGSVTSAPAALWPDANSNGLPDWWEMKYFGNLRQTGSGDFDGDGISNLDEYLEGTNPADAHSFNPRLRIQSTHGIVSTTPLQRYYTNGQSVALVAQADPGHDFLRWDGGVSGTNASVTVVMNTNKLVVPRFGLTLAAALDNPTLAWSTGGGAPWVGQSEVSYDGSGAAQSGSIVSYWNGSAFTGQNSWLETIVETTEALQLSFWWLVSSEPPDALNFLIDGRTNASLSGATGGWEQFKTNLLSGRHTLVWNYSKGPVDLPGALGFLDSGWVDQVSLTTLSGSSIPPFLEITLVNRDAALLSWPSASGIFALQKKLDINSPTWVPVTNQVISIADQYQVMIAPTNVVEFFRLAHP